MSERVRLPHTLPAALDVSHLNTRLKAGEASLDWSDVREAPADALASLLAGLDRMDHADTLGLDTVPEALGVAVEAALSRTEVAETLLDPDVPGEEVRSRADLIIQMVDRLERMATETLDFARGGTRLARRGVDLSRLLNEMAADLVDELPGLEVVRDFRVPKGARAAVDVDKLRRAVTNIAANALDAMGGRGRFHMSAVLEEAAAANGQARRLVLVLGDEGPGVPEEIRDRVFDPFVTRGKKAGTGLGLAVSRRFIEDHAGTVELLPEGPGARFRITLPLGAAEGPTS